MSVDECYYDSITNGYSIEWLKQKYSFVMSQNPNHYVFILVNVKHFSYLYYQYGKEGSDMILRLIYEEIKKQLKEDEFVARLHHDEFGILLRCENMHSFLHEKMLSIIDSLYRIQDERIYRNIFFSFGIFSLGMAHQDFDDMYCLANLARKSSNTLLNRSHCYELYENSIVKAYCQERELEKKTAFAFLNYEFISYFQPKVDLVSNKIVGAESLLRWVDQDGKLVPLNEFLPILNRNGYISIIDLDIFDVVCRMLHDRIKMGKKVVPISFNFSKANFYKTDIIQDYLTIFQKYDIPSKYIEFELMESITLDDTQRMTTIIQQLKDAGFHCALDDFGSGYSSFHVLMNANLDTIKMDRAFFIEGLNDKNKTIIQTIIDLIHSFKMKVVAEGVETKEYVEYLKECGCETIQGYYFYKPLPMHEFESLLDAMDD